MPGSEVEEKILQSIWKDAGVLMKAGMTDRRIVTTRPSDRPHRGGKPLKEEAHYVYRRQGKHCFVCGTKILTTVMAGRNLFWCPSCQPNHGDSK
jgi:endonuclease-8